MKKLHALSALLLAMTLLLCACAPKEQPGQVDDPVIDSHPQLPDANTAERPGENEPASEPDTQTFTAEVLECRAKSLLVESEQEPRGKIDVQITGKTELLSNTDGELHSVALSEIVVGDTVKITYDGLVAETEPVQITADSVTVVAHAGPTALPLLDPVEGEWADAATLTGERVTVEESDDAIVLRALADFEKVELARVDYDEQKQDYVQRDLLWMADVWTEGSELAVVEKTPLDRPDLAISWQDEYGERERRLILPLKVKAGQTLTRSVSIMGYLPPFAAVELTAGLDSQANGGETTATDAYRGVNAYGFVPTKTEIVRRLNYDLDGCGRKESVQLLRLWDEYDQVSFALRIIKNGVRYDVGVVTDEENGDGSLPHASPQLWLADLDRDNLVEIFFGGELSSDGNALSVWTVDEKGPRLIRIDGEAACFARVLSIDEQTVTLERELCVLGVCSGQCRYCFGSSGELIQLDAYWQVKQENLLTLKKALPVTMDDGSQATLPVGTKLTVTATDDESVAFFKTESGLTGSIAIERGENYAYWMIGGLPDQDYFDALAYEG